LACEINGGSENPCRSPEWLEGYREANDIAEPCPYVTLDEETDVASELVQWSMADRLQLLAPEAVRALLDDFAPSVRYELLLIARAALMDSRVVLKLRKLSGG
jgi:hypothetical protein